MNSAKTIMLVSAGKLATIPGTAAAGKEELPKERPPLALHEIANPIDAIVPPMNNKDYEHKGTPFEQTGEDFKGAGLIFAGDKGELRLDFIVNHLFFPEGVKELDVFVAYSSSVGYFEDNEDLPGLEHDEYYDNDQIEARSGHIGDKKPDQGRGQDDEDKKPDQGQDDEDKKPDQGRGQDDEDKKPDQGRGQDDDKKPGQAQQGDHDKKPDQAQQGESDNDNKPAKRPVYKPGKPLGDRVKPNKKAPKPPKVAAGKLCLDMTNVKIIAGVRVQAPQQFLDAPTPLGKVLPNPNSVSVSVKLSDLHQFEDEEVYFQALAVPAGEDINFEQAQVSECDRFLIVQPEENKPGSGSKADPFSGSSNTQTTSTPGKIPE